MELKILSDSNKTLLINIEDEDISIPQVIQHELLEDEHIVFAGVIKQHPLINRLTLRIQSKDIEPLDVLVSKSLKAVEKSAVILSEVRRSLDEKKEV